MKILKRNYEHRNLIIFLVSSMVYLQAIYSLSRGETVVSPDIFKVFIKNHYLILLLTTLTIYMVVKLKKHSDKILLICLGIIVSKNFIMLAASFNKLILGLNFVYLVFAFYFFVTWELEIAKASYNPLFTKRDLEKETRFNIAAKVENVATGSSHDVLITNIDENSCFALVSGPIQEMDSSATYRLMAEYEGVLFVNEAHLASTYDVGIGMDFKKVKRVDYQLNWSDLYKVCLERGLFN